MVFSVKKPVMLFRKTMHNVNVIKNAYSLACDRFNALFVLLIFVLNQKYIIRKKYRKYLYERNSNEQNNIMFWISHFIRNILDIGKVWGISLICETTCFHWNCLIETWNYLLNCLQMSRKKEYRENEAFMSAENLLTFPSKMEKPFRHLFYWFWVMAFELTMVNMHNLRL